MHAWSSRRCVGSSALQIESVVWRTRRRGQPATSRQLLSCSVPRWQPCRSRVCFAALSPQTESSCQVLRESSSCARASAAFCASGSLHLYSWTRHSVVPLESSEIELHSTTSARRVRFLLQPATVTTAASAISIQLYSWTRHSVVPVESSEIELHSTTSARRVRFLLQPATVTTAASAISIHDGVCIGP